MKPIGIHIPDTDRVNPVDVCRNAGEDGGLLGSVASPSRHKAGDPMDVVFPINKAVQRAARVALRGDSKEHLWYYRHNV